MTYDKKFLESLWAIFDLFFRLVGPPVIFSFAIAALVYGLTFLSSAKPAMWELSTHTMFTFFGVAVGTLTGIPKSSPMGQVLPAVITVVTAIMAYLSTKELSSRFKELIPLYVFQFLLGSISGFFYGDWIKG